ncbi:MAG: CNNM domain-containing protein [Aureliella sp.]
MIAFLILIAGISLSAFFSGSETGFYRVTRVRLLMDSKSGRRAAKFLLWLVGKPSLVVATVLIGNNVANYLVSLGLVLASQSILGSWSESVQVMLPVLATPFLFIYGELLPKYLYYNAPYALSMRGAPFMLLCTLGFLPLSGIIVAAERLWRLVFGTDNDQSKFELERKELQRVLLEGHEVGVLAPAQRDLAQNLFTFGPRPVRQFAIPIRALPIVDPDLERTQALEACKRTKQKFVGVRIAPPKGSSDTATRRTPERLDGCFLVSDLVLFSEMQPEILPVLTVPADQSSIEVLAQLQSAGCPMAQLEDAKKNVIGVVLRERLTMQLASS